MPGNYVPDNFIEFCKEANEPDDKLITNFKPTVEITVKFGNHNISQLNSVKKITDQLGQNIISKLVKNELKIVTEMKEKSINASSKTLDDSRLSSESLDTSLVENSNDSIDDSGLPESVGSETELDVSQNDCSVPESTENDSMLVNSSGLSESLDSSINEQEITDSNMETQPPCNQSQDLFSTPKK